MSWEGQRCGRQLDRVGTIGHQQDHLDPDDLHRGQRALAHRDRPAGRTADLHRAPADRRAHLVAAAGTHRRRALPGRPAAADDRQRSPRRRRPPPSGRRACWRTLSPPPAAAPGSACCTSSRSPTSRSSPAAARSRGFTPAATLPAHPTALGRALLAFSPSGVVEMTIMRGLRPYTAHTVTSPDRFRRALTVTRLTRVAVTRFELEARRVCGGDARVRPGRRRGGRYRADGPRPGPPPAARAGGTDDRGPQPLPRARGPHRDGAGRRADPAPDRTLVASRGQLTRSCAENVAMATFSAHRAHFSLTYVPGPVAEHRVRIAPYARRVDHRPGVLRPTSGPVLPPRAGGALGGRLPARVGGRSASRSSPIHVPRPSARAG